MSEYLTDVTIDKVFPKREGINKNGKPYVSWGFVVNGITLSSFEGPKSPVPVEGALVQALEYEVNGKYNNVKWFKYESDPLPQTGQKPQDGPPDDYEPPGNLPKGSKMVIPTPAPPRDASFYISYAKDLQVAMIENAMTPPGQTLDELCEEVVTVGLKMLKGAMGGE